MQPVELLADLRSRVEEIRVEGDRLRWRPADAVPRPLVAELRRAKAELLPMAAILQALDGAAHLTAPELQERTRLSTEAVYHALGELYHAAIIRTDSDSLAYWIAACPDRRCSWDGRGRVLLCRLCGVGVNAARQVLATLSPEVHGEAQREREELRTEVVGRRA